MSRYNPQFNTRDLLPRTTTKSGEAYRNPYGLPLEVLKAMTPAELERHSERVRELEAADAERTRALTRRLIDAATRAGVELLEGSVIAQAEQLVTAQANSETSDFERSLQERYSTRVERFADDDDEWISVPLATRSEGQP